MELLLASSFDFELNDICPADVGGCDDYDCPDADCADY